MFTDDALVLFDRSEVEALEYYTLRDYLMRRLLTAGFSEAQIDNVTKIEFERIAEDETDEDRVSFDFFGGWASLSTFSGSWDHQAQHASLSYSRDGSIVDHVSPIELSTEDKMAQFSPNSLELYSHMSVTIQDSHEV